MKPEETPDPQPAAQPDEIDGSQIIGDVIGDTAYSQTFVLKILLKFANLDTLKEEIQQESFEEELCLLWDMTAEKDVVDFLQKHNVLNLFQFALPTIVSDRVTEIIIGIIGNMCCQKEVVEALLKTDAFLTTLLQFLSSDDSLILIQVLRLVSSGVYLSSEDQITKWMDIFEDTEYASRLFFILQNSCNKDLLVTALENLNGICSLSDTHGIRSKFYDNFVSEDGLVSMVTGCSEVFTQKDECKRDELERTLLISLNILIVFTGLENSEDVFHNCKDSISKMVQVIFDYHENKFVSEKDISTDFAKVVGSIINVCDKFSLYEHSGTNVFSEQSFKIWLSLESKECGNRFEDDISSEEMKEACEGICVELCKLILKYIESCTESDLQKCLSIIRDHYDTILNCVIDKNLVDSVKTRVNDYRSKIRDGVDS